MKPYGKGYFIYYAAMEPLLGHSGWAPGMYSYAIFRKAIEWAFENAKLPVVKMSPWPYPYDAAFMMRHDLEDYADEIAHVADSAQYEKSLGVFADYYFCTGTLRVDMPTNGYNTAQVITNLQFAATNYGSTFGPHNGGFQNPNNTNLVETNYDYWHWGPDEALNLTNVTYQQQRRLHQRLRLCPGLGFQFLHGHRRLVAGHREQLDAFVGVALL